MFKLSLESYLIPWRVTLFLYKSGTDVQSLYVRLSAMSARAVEYLVLRYSALW
jgi:hypothetical protein